MTVLPTDPRLLEFLGSVAYEGAPPGILADWLEEQGDDRHRKARKAPGAVATLDLFPSARLVHPRRHLYDYAGATGSGQSKLYSLPIDLLPCWQEILTVLPPDPPGTLELVHVTADSSGRASIKIVSGGPESQDVLSALLNSHSLLNYPTGPVFHQITETLRVLVRGKAAGTARVAITVNYDANLVVTPPPEPSE